MAASRRVTRAGQRLACLHAEAVPAAWLVASRDWWPQPRVVSPNLANADWRSDRCRECGAYRVQLVARGVVEPREEITVPQAVSSNVRTVYWPFEVFFDGATRRTQRGRCSGAGAMHNFKH